MSGVAPLWTMLFFEMSRVCSTATNCFSTPSLLRNPLLSAAFDTNTNDDAGSALPKAPTIGRQCRRCPRVAEGAEHRRVVRRLRRRDRGVGIAHLRGDD